MKITLNKHIFYTYILAYISLAFVCYYIWFRFLRERLPKEIPFNLTFFTFIFLCFICLSYVYIIFKILHKYHNNSYFINLIFSKFSSLIKPLIDSHNFFLVKWKLNNFFIKNFVNIIKKYSLYDDKMTLKWLLVFDFFPKLIILFFFLLDVFYFKKLNIFYYFLILGIIPLFHTYYIYTSNISLEILLKYLQENYYVKILSTHEEEQNYKKRKGLSSFFVSLRYLKYNDYGVLDLRYFVNIQAANLIFEHDLYKYTCIETAYAREVYAKQQNIELPEFSIFEPEFDYISKKLALYFFDNIEKAIYLQAFLEVYKDIAKPIMVEKHSLFILIGYLIGWVYILLVSLHTLNLYEVLDILNTIKINMDPFLP